MCMLSSVFCLQGLLLVREAKSGAHYKSSQTIKIRSWIMDGRILAWSRKFLSLSGAVKPFSRQSDGGSDMELLYAQLPNILTPIHR